MGKDLRKEWNKIPEIGDIVRTCYSSSEQVRCFYKEYDEFNSNEVYSSDLNISHSDTCLIHRKIIQIKTSTAEGGFSVILDPQPPCRSLDQMFSINWCIPILPERLNRFTRIL